MSYGSMRDELVKIAIEAQEAAAPTGLSGLGTHIARTINQRGGSYNMMLLNIRDPMVDQFTSRVMQMANRGNYIGAKQLAIQARFPTNLQDKVLGAIDSLQTQPAIPEHFRVMALRGAFDSA